MGSIGVGGEEAEMLPQYNAGPAKPIIDAAIMRRICLLYRLDYVCLRLPVPAECTSVLGSGLLVT